MKRKVYRPRFNEWELKTFRRMVDDEYRRDRRNVRYEKRRVKASHSDKIYPLSEQETHLKKLGRLLRKLNHLLTGKYAINC